MRMYVYDCIRIYVRICACVHDSVYVSCVCSCACVRVCMILCVSTCGAVHIHTYNTFVLCLHHTLQLKTNIHTCAAGRGVVSRGRVTTTFSMHVQAYACLYVCMHVQVVCTRHVRHTIKYTP
jgi:hypothetical protein